jgi:predicted acyl esterase
MSINFGWMPVFASIDKGARPAPNVDIASFLKTLPTIDMADRAGSPSWDWRNFLERSPDDPWWDKQGYLSPNDSVGVAALHVSSWFDMAQEALEVADIFRKNAINERARNNQYAIISPTTHCASEVRAAPRGLAISTSEMHDCTTGRRISRGSIGGSRATRVRSIRFRRSSTTRSAETRGRSPTRGR